MNYRFKNGTVFVVNHEAKRCFTILPDGKEISAIATEDQKEHAQQLGYRTAWDMVRDHEFLHNFLADYKGLPYSNVMHHVANDLGGATDETRYEEGEILMIQKALNELKKIQ